MKEYKLINWYSLGHLHKGLYDYRILLLQEKDTEQRITEVCFIINNKSLIKKNRDKELNRAIRNNTTINIEGRRIKINGKSKFYIYPENQIFNNSIKKLIRETNLKKLLDVKKKQLLANER